MKKAAKTKKEKKKGAGAEDKPYFQTLEVRRWTDVQDANGNWFEGRVHSVDPARKLVCVRIHGFDETQWCDDKHVAPLHSHTVNWRAQVKQGDVVEVRASAADNWTSGQVAQLQRTEAGARVTVNVEPDGRGGGSSNRVVLNTMYDENFRQFIGPKNRRKIAPKIFIPTVVEKEEAKKKKEDSGKAQPILRQHLRAHNSLLDKDSLWFEGLPFRVELQGGKRFISILGLRCRRFLSPFAPTSPPLVYLYITLVPRP